jgi:hypothetical protein
VAARVPVASRTPVHRVIVMPGLVMPVDRLCGSRSALADCVTVSELPAVVELAAASKEPSLPSRLSRSSSSKSIQSADAISRVFLRINHERTHDAGQLEVAGCRYLVGTMTGSRVDGNVLLQLQA